ncbi:deoxyribodipyrimidine photo-lyase [Vibrio sp. CK2-1]|uniref:deoxyribodipyrimidine photo-lyase n=1 Tax=Vibrio sp. CK2-1 TaxID=2912249 RepID=UPI001F26D469|nr:deoxyribodipyrimidine photo-lyase [Vibrio sp. CK2-1]MCF7354144.1 deoxyribodipyrimidine photo-lyase [Vibrio sp. CK2-1]
MNLVWFRNDLRIDDNPALYHAITAEQPFHALFISTPSQWQAHDMAPIKIDLIERHVNLLSEQLGQHGIHFKHIEVSDFAEQAQALIAYCQQQNIETIFANQEVEFNEQQRDQALLDHGLPLTLFEADVIVSKGAVLNGQNEMYKVFTPFKKAWASSLARTHAAPLQVCLPSLKPVSNPAIIFNATKQDSTKWPLADTILEQVIPNFLTTKYQDYHQDRDYPAIKGTSGLSPYLAIGAISAKRVFAELSHHYPNALEMISQPQGSWLNELAWRDFYRHLLHHFPKLNKHHNFNDKYDHLPWPNPPELLAAWQQAKTGYPIVDAAMRQLVQTGWMHNRLRMIVASFLTKHCLVDWRLGEKFFMQHLIDGDLSANNGGWQWAAGTGCDAQPYFRIFNPITQSEKYDPDGSFIRKYLPELENVPLKHLHFPHEYIKQNDIDTYWPAIVDHPTARQQALSFYKAGFL